MKEQVSEPIKKDRSETLRRLGKDKNLAFRKKQVGSQLNVVVEDKRDAKTGLFSGLTDNYIRVHIAGAKKEMIGKEIAIRLTCAEKDDNYGTIV